MPAESTSIAIDHAAIYAKTELGRDEVARRTLGLGARQRSVLIMVDGRKPCAALEATMAPGVVAAILGELAALGLVTAPAPVPAPARQPASARLVAIKRRMRETAEDCLGLMAAEVVRRIERAADEAALLGVLGHWHMALQDSRRGKALALGLVEELRLALEAAAAPWDVSQ